MSGRATISVNKCHHFLSALARRTGFLHADMVCGLVQPYGVGKGFFFVPTAAAEICDAVTDHSGGVVPRGCGYFASGGDARVERKAWRITVT